jgi:hypothetical protein
MANPEHLAKLKEGVEAWNKWVEHNSELALDLSWADLSGTQGVRRSGHSSCRSEGEGANAKIVWEGLNKMLSRLYSSTPWRVSVRAVIHHTDGIKLQVNISTWTSSADCPSATLKAEPAQGQACVIRLDERNSRVVYVIHLRNG